MINSYLCELCLLELRMMYSKQSALQIHNGRYSETVHISLFTLALLLFLLQPLLSFLGKAYKSADYETKWNRNYHRMILLTFFTPLMCRAVLSKRLENNLINSLKCLLFHIFYSYLFQEYKIALFFFLLGRAYFHKFLKYEHSIERLN